MTKWDLKHKKLILDILNNVLTSSRIAMNQIIENLHHRIMMMMRHNQKSNISNLFSETT